MKLRSTLLFAAASFTASALAPVAFPPVAYGAGEIISLNFGKTENNVSDSLTGTAGLATYDKDGVATGVDATGWTNATGQTGSSSTLKNYDGETISGASVSWNAPQDPWGPGGHATETVLGMVQSSYLDLSAGNAWTVSLDSSFLVCDVYVYLSGDGGKYAPVNINGVSYVGGENTTGSTEWGDRSTDASKTIVLGTNAIKVTDHVGGLELSNVVMGDSGKRATLSGIQVVNTYAGTATEANLDGTEPAWTNDAIGSTAWKNSTADAGTYAALTLMADTVLNVKEAVVTDALVVSGADKTLTLVKDENGSLTLSGPALIRVTEGATLAFDSSDVSLGQNISGISLVGTGKISFLNDDATAAYDSFGSSLSFGGTMSFANEVSLATDSETRFSGVKREFAGGVKGYSLRVDSGAIVTIGDSSKFTGPNPDNSEERNTVLVSGSSSVLNITGGEVVFLKALATHLGGVINQSGGIVSATGIRLHDTGGGAGESAYNLSGGVLNLSGDTATDSTSANVLIGHWGWGKGVLNVSDNGVLNAEKTWAVVSWDSPGVFNISGGEVNIKGIILKNNEGAGVTLSGGRLNLGVDGLLSRGKAYNFDGGTLGALDSWSSDAAIVLGGGVKIDTQVRKTSSVGVSTETEDIASITLNGVISGSGGIEKIGQGVLTLSGENSFTGDVKISEGELVVKSGSALGKGKVYLESGTLERATDSVLVIGGALTVSDGATLKLGAVSSDAVAVSAQGVVTINNGAILEASWHGEGSSLQLLSSTMGITGATGDQIKSNLYLNGVLVNQNATVKIENSSIVLDLATPLDLVWAGGKDGVWECPGEGWTKEGDVSATFQSGDNAIFSSTATVSIKNKVIANNVTVGENATLTLTGGTVSVLGTITLNSGAKIFGNGKIDFGATATLPTNLPESFVSEDPDVAGWTGTVALSGRTNLTDFLFSDYVVSGSSIEVSGLAGFFKGGQSVSNVVLQEGTSLILRDATSGASAFTVTDGSSPSSYVFKGSIVGDGTFEHRWANGRALKYEFDGDVSEWTGALKHNGKTGTRNSIIFKEGSTAKDVKVDIINIAGGLDLRFEVSDTSTYAGAVSGVAVDLFVDTGTLVWEGQRDQTGGNVTIASGATLDVSSETGKLYSGTIYSNGQVLIQGTLKVRDYGYGGSLGNLKTNGDGTEIVIIDGGSLVFTNTHETPRATIVNGSGGVVQAEKDVFVTLNGNEHGCAFTTKGGELKFGGEGNITLSGSKGIITGAARVVKDGTGVLTLSGANTYTGGTTINGGVLKATQDAALSSGPIVLNENGTLEIAYDGFAHTITGTGTLAKSSSDDLVYSAGEFSGSFDVRSGLLALTAAKDQAFKNLKISSDATFKANQNVSFATIDASGTLSGTNSLTRVSVANGTFSGTLSSIALVKTGDGSLDLSNAKFATGGKVIVEAGTASNLTLADGGTLQLSGASAGQITLNNLTLGMGTIIIDELFDATTAMATISGGVTGDSVSLTLDISGIGYKTTYALFTFDDAAKTAWESIFGTLTAGKFNSNLTLSGGIGTTENGVFSWDGNTLCFYEDRDAREFTWIATNGSGTWNFTDNNWNQPPEAFVNNMAAIFDATKVEDGYYAQDKNVTISVAEEVRATSVAVKLGESGYLSLKDEGGTLKIANGISVESGTLNFVVSDTEFYTDSFAVGAGSTLVLTPNLANGTNALILENSFSGTGTIRYATEDKELTLSGDRSQFKGTLDVDAGTVVLANGTGMEELEEFSIDIADGATVSATSGAAVNDFNSLTLGNVAGNGTLVANSQGSGFYALDLSGSTFDGVVELNGVDAVLALNPNDSHVTKVSNFEKAKAVRLTNGAALTFFNKETKFETDIEVAATHGSVRVYEDNTGVTISGYVSGAGTLTVKDGGAITFTGGMNLGTLNVASASKLELAGGEKQLGTVTAANSTEVILGGTIRVENSFERGGNNKITKILDGAKLEIGETWKFNHNAQIEIGKNATVSADTLTAVWGFDTISLGEGSSLTLESFDSWSDGATPLSQVVSGAGSDKSTIVVGQIHTKGHDSFTFEDIRVEFSGVLDGGVVSAIYGNDIVFKNAVIAVAENVDGWTTEGTLRLGGDLTTFDVAEGKEITITKAIKEAVETASGEEGTEGYVAATSSTLVKTGAGTLVLGQGNANEGGTQINGGVLKYTNTAGVTLGTGKYTFNGGALAAGASTTVSVGAGTEFSGDAILTGERSGKFLFTEDFAYTSGFSLNSGVTVEIADGKKLTLSDLRFTGTGASKVSVPANGTGVLALNGRVSVENRNENVIGSDLALGADSEVSVVSGGKLKIQSATFDANGNKLTKTGAGELIFASDAISNFGGSLAVLGGTVNAGSYLVAIGDGNSFELQNATFKGDLELEKASATLGGGTSKIEGNVSVANTALTFGGKVTGIGTLTWGDGNTVVLTDAFKATFSGTTTLLDFNDAVDADGNALTAETSFAGVFKEEIFLGRDVELVYNADATSLDITVTGTLQWNGDVDHWVQTENVADWDAAKWDVVTKNGLIEKGEAFSAGKFVEFNKAGSITLVGTASRIDGTIYGTGPINTAGMIFNIADNGQFRVTAAYESAAEDAKVATYLQGVERTGENGEKTYVDDGITILAGNVSFDATVDNRLTGGMRIFGGELWVSNEQSLGDGTITLGDSAGTTAAKLGFNGGTTLEQKVIIGNEAVTIDVADGRGTVTISNALEKDATATTAKLTKAGAGTLVIQSGTALDGITVSGGKLTLADDGNAIGTKVFTVGAGATLNIANGAETGENSTLENLTLAGALRVDGDFKAFRAGTISVVGDASITGNLYVGSETSFKNGEKDVAGTLINVASGASLALTGSVNAYGTDAAALYKQGAGSLRFASNATLDADFVHSGGTVIVSEGLTATKSYTVDGAGTRIQINSGKSATFSNFAVTETGRLTVQINPNANAVFNGFAAADSALTVFAGTDINSVRTATIDGNGKDVALGNIEIGGLTKQQWLVNLTVNADKIKAGTVSLGAASMLKLATAGADATAKALVVESYQGQVSTLDLSSGATFKLENTENIAVLQGAGTLKVVGGTLSVKGQNYSSELSPKVLLDGAAFNFEVTGDGTKDNLPVYSSLSAISTTEKGGTVSKSGTGTLVLLEGDDAGWFTPTSDMAFNGTIAANGGDLQVYATMSNADVAIAADGRLTVFAEAELGDSVDEVNTLAKKLSGTGTLVARGYLYANGGLDSFDGKLIAGGDGATDVGYLYVYNTTEAWLSSGAATRGVGVENGGMIFAAEADVALKAVSLTGSGALYGSYDLTTGEEFSLSVDAVNATSGSTLELLGTGTLGALSFADAAAGSTATNTLALSWGDWTLSGASTNLTKVAVDTGMLTVANAGALGTAAVSVSDGVLSITADGQYANAIELSGDAAAVQALGKVDLSDGTLSSDASTKIVFVAGKENNDGTKTAGTLTLSETVFGLATGDITFNAVDGTIAVNTANAQTFKGKLSGAGTFEKTGAGTLTVNTDSGSVGTFSVAAGSVEFGSAAQLKAHGETTGTLSVANGASAKINGTNLSEFVLGGEGTVTVDGGELAGMKDAKNVSVTAGKTLSVSGDISGSTVALNGATLKTNGTTAQTISGTTLSGATVTLSNENASAAVVYDSTVTLSDATTLVLNAGTGISGGEFAGAYDGSLTKTGDGKWTVSGYTYGKNGGEALNVNGGTLEWKNANFGSNAGTISLGTGATLSVNGLASGDTLAGTVSGDASTTLEIANTTLTLATTVATDAKWGVKISDTDASNGNAVVTINSALPGRLEVAGTATAKLALGSGSTMEMGENDQLTVAEGATLELASGTLTVANASKDRLNTIDGNVTVAAGSTFAQNAGIRWNTGSTLDIEGTYSISVGDLGNTGWNKAKITGAGTLEIKNTSSAGYDISGEVSDFAGTLSVASGAKVNLTSGASFDDVANVEIDSGATLEVAHDLGGTLDKLSGAGNVVINADSSKNNFPNAVYAWGTNNAGFSGNVAVKSGALAVSQADLTSLGARLSVSGEHVARYSESAKFSGIYQGAFLKVTTPGSIDVSVLGQNGGMILSGGEYVAGTTFGNAGKGNLYVVEKDSTLKLAPSADVNGSLFVAYGATLDIGATSSVSMFRANGTGGNNVVNGDFTLNGTLVVDVDESNVNKTLVDVAGTTNLASGKQGPAKVEIYAADTTTDLSNSDITIFNNYKDTKRNLEDVVEVEVMGRPVEVSRDAKGNIVVVSAVNDYTAPSGLQDLYGAIRGKGTSALWSYLKSDRANAEMMDSKLVALSPVSYGSLVEMQSGFVALENDLLRDRLEQRRYERAFASNAQKQFKPFVNILGSQREGDGNGTESANYDVSHTGAIGGFDVAVSRNTIFGVSLGFDWAKADLHDGAGKHEGDTTRLGVYGMSVFENAYFGYGLSAGATSFDTKRNSGYNGETLTGSTDGNDVNASVIFGAGWTIDEQLGLDLAPYVGLDLAYAYAKSFTEEGGKQTALDIEKMERWSLRGKIGATLSWRASERTRISFDASFSHEFLDSDMDIDATFASGDLAGTAFSSTAYLMDENTISIGPRVDYRIDDTWSVSGGYSYETDLDDTVTHSANVGFRARF